MRSTLAAFQRRQWDDSDADNPCSVSMSMSEAASTGVKLSAREEWGGEERERESKREAISAGARTFVCCRALVRVREEAAMR